MSADTEKARKKSDYEFYKEHGICVNCRHEKARHGKTLCWRCAANYSDSEKSNRKPPSEEHKQYLKDRREQKRGNGVCVICGAEKATEGTTTCRRCREKAKRRAEERRRSRGVLPRSMMGTGEYCYFCGKPTDGKKLCEDCYERCKSQMLYARTFKKKENDWFRKLENLRHAEFESKENCDKVVIV